LPTAIRTTSPTAPTARRFPTLHLLREASLDRAVAAFPDAAAIYERNMQTLTELGDDGWRQLGLSARRGRGKAMTIGELREDDDRHAGAAGGQNVNKVGTFAFRVWSLPDDGRLALVRFCDGFWFDRDALCRLRELTEPAQRPWWAKSEDFAAAVWSSQR
jgi:hypothetical protein